jgi:hypothetical protein
MYITRSFEQTVKKKKESIFTHEMVENTLAVVPVGNVVFL